MGLIKNVDVKKVVVMDDVNRDVDVVLPDGWDAIQVVHINIICMAIVHMTWNPWVVDMD